MHIHWGWKLLKEIAFPLQDPSHVLFWIRDSSPVLRFSRRTFHLFCSNDPGSSVVVSGGTRADNPPRTRLRALSVLQKTLWTVRSLLECPPTLPSPFTVGDSSKAEDVVEIKHRKSSRCYEMIFWHWNKCMNINNALASLRLAQNSLLMLLSFEKTLLFTIHFFNQSTCYLFFTSPGEHTVKGFYYTATQLH